MKFSTHISYFSEIFWAQSTVNPFWSDKHLRVPAQAPLRAHTSVPQDVLFAKIQMFSLEAAGLQFFLCMFTCRTGVGGVLFVIYMCQKL